MRKVKFGDEMVSVQGGPWALHLYEREFAPEHSDFYEDVAKYNANPLIGKRFASPMFLLRCLWAMAANYGEIYSKPFPTWEEWAKTVDVPLREGDPWTEEVISALNAEIFRPAEDNAGRTEED